MQVHVDQFGDGVNPGIGVATCLANVLVLPPKMYSGHLSLMVVMGHNTDLLSTHQAGAPG